jgi:hypothetical protein
MDVLEVDVEPHYNCDDHCDAPVGAGKTVNQNWFVMFTASLINFKYFLQMGANVKIMVMVVMTLNKLEVMVGDFPPVSAVKNDSLILSCNIDDVTNFVCSQIVGVERLCEAADAEFSFENGGDVGGVAVAIALVIVAVLLVEFLGKMQSIRVEAKRHFPV